MFSCVLLFPACVCSCVKGWFRSAKALQGLGKLDLAAQAAQKAQQLETNNRDVSHKPACFVSSKHAPCSSPMHQQHGSRQAGSAAHIASMHGSIRDLGCDEASVYSCLDTKGDMDPILPLGNISATAC